MTGGKPEPEMTVLEETAGIVLYDALKWATIMTYNQVHWPQVFCLYINSTYRSRKGRRYNEY